MTLELITPMEPVSRPDVVSGSGWLHEIKWDGIRGIVYIESGNFRILTKRGNERTAFYPELSVLPKLLKADSAILDGEIVVFDEAGRPSFYSSLVRERVRSPESCSRYSNRYPAKYIVFDILYSGGSLLTEKPLAKRREILKRELEVNETVAITDQFENGEALYSLMKEKGWEGIVSKRTDSLYIPGKKHKLWYKTKFFKKILAVIGGIQWKDNLPNSLLLGVYKAGELTFIGKAATGLSQEHIYLLKDNYYRLENKSCPFKRDTLHGSAGTVTWLKPALTCWVGFAEFTDDGVLRHPKILGFASSGPGEADGKELVL